MFGLFKKRVSYNEVCGDFYKLILDPSVKDMDMGDIVPDSIHKFILEKDSSFRKVDKNKLKKEIEIIRFEIFSLAWTHKFLSGEKVLIQSAFTRKFLQENGQEEIWCAMQHYNNVIDGAVLHWLLSLGRSNIIFNKNMRTSICESNTKEAERMGLDESIIDISNNRAWSEAAWEPTLVQGGLLHEFCNKVGIKLDELNNEAQIALIAMIQGFYEGSKLELKKVKITFPDFSSISDIKNEAENQSVNTDVTVDFGEISKKIHTDDTEQEYEEEYDIEKIDGADTSLAYEFIDAGVDVSDHLDKFVGEKSSKLALKIIEADSEFGIFNVTKNIDKFTDLNQKTAELLIENDESDVVLENICKFSIIDESKLALKIIDHNSALGAFDVAQAFDKFTDLNQEVAESLVENDESYAVLENFNKFLLTNESRLALKIISHDPDGTYLTVDNLDKFKNLSEKVVSEIIKDKSGTDESPTHFEELNSNLESFTKEAQELIIKCIHLP